jgi:hypothetical protein
MAVQGMFPFLAEILLCGIVEAADLFEVPRPIPSGIIQGWPRRSPRSCGHLLLGVRIGPAGGTPTNGGLWYRLDEPALREFFLDRVDRVSDLAHRRSNILNTDFPVLGPMF